MSLDAYVLLIFILVIICHINNCLSLSLFEYF